MSELGYLYDGPQSISYILRKFIIRSEGYLDACESLTNSIRNFEVSLRSDNNDQRFKILIEKNFHYTLVYTVDACNKIENAELIKSVISLLIYITYKSVIFIDAFMSTNLAEILINAFIKYSLSRNSSWHSSLIIVYNIVIIPQFRKEFQEKLNIEKFKDLLKCLCSSTDEEVKMVSMSVMGCVIKENDDDKIEVLKSSKAVECIIEYITKARNAENETYNGYGVWELLFGLHALTSIECFKVIFHNTTNAIPTIMAILSKSSVKSKDIYPGLSIIWNLCNNEFIKEFLKKKYNIETVIKRFIGCGIELIEKITDNILKKLYKEIYVSEVTFFEYDVFISFSDADKNIMLKVEYFLKQIFRVYSRNDNETEFEGIKTSQILIAGLSNSCSKDEKYKSELLHACNKRRFIIPLVLDHKFKPCGWLSNVINMKDSIDFSNSSSFQMSFLKLCKSLNKNNIKSVENPVELQINMYKPGKNINKPKNRIYALVKQFEPHIFTENMKSSNDPKIKDLKSRHENGSHKGVEIWELEDDLRQLSQGKNVDFTQWSKSDVSEWLTKNNLSEIHNKLCDFDGEMIKTVLEMRKISKETYYHMLEVSLKLSFVEILRFDCALNKLEK